MTMHLSSLLEEGEWGPLVEEPEIEELDNYAEKVMAHYYKQKEIFSSDRVFVFNGKPWGVIPFSNLVLHRAANPKFDHTFEFELRRRFEASTGINCNAFFRKGIFRPLAVAAIVEFFLEGEDAKRYKDGNRYFFGQKYSRLILFHYCLAYRML